ncbi:MAG: fumarate hydratase [Syntrophales bacterium]|jgi:fumarate hydratase subunit alpha|nr:fumarate hydratase [Syntrophales bacterium]MCK9528303.1 fumarate hydratase [Syntrophales bacterium]MDX9922142.1 fumarate hydratase [Syntrophales bacterium]
MGTVRTIQAAEITEAVRDLFIRANSDLGDDVLDALKQALLREDSRLARSALVTIIENITVAREESLPLCQDTGLAVIFAEVGQDIHVGGGDFNEALQEGVRRAYTEGYLRKSLCDPLTRQNTGDNTPAVIHTEIVPGDRIRITAMPKGGGSENMSVARMLVPSAGLEGIKQLVIETVRQAGPNACPPVTVGVGIGGSLEKSAILAKKALMRPLDPDGGGEERLRLLERDILDGINNLGIGPQGYGGTVTALAVHVEMSPCHISSLPVTVNLQCHASRHRDIIL